MLVGRSAEREVLRGLLARAAEGFSGAVVLRGEPGAGKTALLEDTVAAAVAAGLQTARLTGVEPETQLGYAGLHRLLLPFTGRLDRLPDPQRDALRSTFGEDHLRPVLPGRARARPAQLPGRTELHARRL
jgi:AAA ATPase domain